MFIRSYFQDEGAAQRLTEIIIRFHDIQLAATGGSPGIRDRGLIESAVGRLEMALHYNGDNMGPLEPAAILAHAIMKNHAFVDGNKRTAFGIMEMLTRCEGVQLNLDDDEIVEKIVEFAAGDQDQSDIAAWLAENCLSTQAAASPSIS